MLATKHPQTPFFQCFDVGDALQNVSPKSPVDVRLGRDLVTATVIF